MNTVCFDVDGTLQTKSIQWRDIPRYEIVAFFKSFEAAGCRMFIWSGGGLDYAKAACERLGLKAEIVVKGSFKPDIAVDDEAVQLGKVNIQVPLATFGN